MLQPPLVPNDGAPSDEEKLQLAPPLIDASYEAVVG
jgi:hypothetical protein